MKKNKRNEENRAKLMAVDEGAPFFIQNADAEDLTDSANLKLNPVYKSRESAVTIVEDDLRPGNHAYLVMPGTEAKTWTYFRASTRFKPGMTYNVEFDIRLIGDTDGKEASKVGISLNPRYTDVVNGEFKSMADHPVKLDPLTYSTSDGWVRVKATFTVNETSEIRETDELSIFANPTGDNDNFTNYAYMVDNFVVTVAE